MSTNLSPVGGAAAQFLDNILGINGTGIATNANAVAYDPAGLGAVATNVQNKLRETVSVKDFGAVGDGVTDDWAAIQAAIEHVIANPASLRFPDGTYLITQALLIDETSGVELKADSYRGAAIKKTGNAVDGHYGVDALLIIKNTSPGYGYSHHIDGINLDATASSNAFGLYAPRISQTVVENMQINGAKTGVYSDDAWLCSFRNVNVACGDPQTPTIVPAGSIGYSFGIGTSLFMQNCWARVCQDGYFFRTGMAYSAMVSCACDHFSGYAYRFVGSNFSMDGCGAEASVGSGSILIDANNSRLSVNAMQTTALAPAYFFNLAGAEVAFINCRIDDTTSAGTGITFRLRSSSTLNFIGRLYPSNTATLLDITAGSQVYVQDRDTGWRQFTFTTQLNVNNFANPSGIAVYGNSTPRANYFGSTTLKSQIEGTAFGTSALGLVGNSASTGNGGLLVLGKSKGTLAGSNDLVANGDALGSLAFVGADGTNLVQAAGIAAVVDGAPGTNDMPGRLELATSPDGSASPVTRVRIKSTGSVNFVPLSSDPAGAAAGDVYYNSSTNKLRCYNGTSWNDLF